MVVGGDSFAGLGWEKGMEGIWGEKLIVGLGIIREVSMIGLLGIPLSLCG